MRTTRLALLFCVPVSVSAVALACSSKNINISPQESPPEAGPSDSAPPPPPSDGGTDANTPSQGCTFEAYTPVAADGGVLDYAGWPMPDSYGSFHAPEYDLATNGVVIDKITGLVWQKGVAPTARTFGDAVTYCSSLSIGTLTAGWRVPTRIELESIISWGSPTEAGLPQPGLPGAFDPLPRGGTFWTSTPVAGTPSQRWTVLFVNLIFGPVQSPDSATFEVRCVHDGAAPAPKGKFSVSKDCGIVRDENTKLEWQRDFKAVSYANNPRNFCATLELGAPNDKGGWRLPTMQEMYTLVDTSRQDPTLDPALFPGSQSQRFITDTLIGVPNSDPIAAAINFQDGSQDAVSPGDTLPVRCMRPAK